eukprot:scaffold582218_cov38-Prasinocladus_malaysianus.AAC.1
MSQALLQIFFNGQVTPRATSPQDPQGRAGQQEGRPWLLSVLVGARSAVDAHPCGCGEFFQLLVTCIQNINTAEESQTFYPSAVAVAANAAIIGVGIVNVGGGFVVVVVVA